MKRLDTKEFTSYIANTEPRFLYNPNCDVAFKDVGFGENGKLYCKGRGKKEWQIDRMDEDFELAMLMHYVMTKEEYEKF